MLYLKKLYKYYKVVIAENRKVFEPDEKSTADAAVDEKKNTLGYKSSL